MEVGNEEAHVDNLSQLFKLCGQNRISQALLLQQQALQINVPNQTPTGEQSSILLVGLVWNSDYLFSHLLLRL